MTEQSSNSNRYNVGVDPTHEQALQEAESRAISVVDRIEFGQVRTVIVGIYTQSVANELKEHQGIDYVEIDENLTPD